MFGASNLSDGRKCSFYSCQSIEGRCDESFLRFPIKNSGRCEQWVKNSGNITLSRLHIENLKNKFICEDHFDSESYHISGLRELLYAAAVPREYKQTIKLEGKNLNTLYIQYTINILYTINLQYTINTY